jgi:hypothetical protein
MFTQKSRRLRLATGRFKLQGSGWFKMRTMFCPPAFLCLVGRLDPRRVLTYLVDVGRLLQIVF